MQKVRVIPFGGLGEIGKNMLAIEYGESILVIDAGVRFPTAEMHGIDLVLPDFSYLVERAKNIEAIILTHGHEDHVGALPFFLRQLPLGELPQIYGGALTLAMVRSKLDEHRIKHAELEVLPCGDILEAGAFEVELVHVTHSIPDSCAVVVQTPEGKIVVTGDYKFDQTPVDGPATDITRLADLGSEGVLLLCGDSTNADRPGFSVSEAQVGPNLKAVFAQCQGRIVVTSFASNIHRVQQVFDAAAALERKVVLVGRSMRKNVKIARSLNHLSFDSYLLINTREMIDYDDDELIILSTGSQGEPLSALRRMAHRDHPQIALHAGDTVVFSATPIPGNERAVNETVDRLYQLGCEVVTTADAPIHASGHGYVEELKLMLNLLKPTYFLPVHGDYKRLRLHGNLAEQVGMAAEAVFLGKNGLPLEIKDGKAAFGSREQAGMIFVDGIDLGEAADVALRDRRTLSQDGIAVAVVAVSEQDGVLITEPEIVLRGVPLGEEEEQAVEQLTEIIEDALRDAANDNIREVDLLQQFVHDELAAALNKLFKRRPLVIAVAIEL